MGKRSFCFFATRAGPGAFVDKDDRTAPVPTVCAAYFFLAPYSAFRTAAVTVNAVAPGLIETDMAEFVRSADGEAFALSKQALKRIGQPADVASVVRFLAGDDSRGVTGQTIEAAGGSGLTFG
ncbi:MAG: SDR family oxidoreductase [Hyphomicrobium sp.]